MKLLYMKEEQDWSAEENKEGKEQENGKAREEVRTVLCRLGWGLSPCLCKSEIKLLNSYAGWGEKMFVEAGIGG